MHALECKVPPLVVLFAAALLMAFLAYAFPSFSFPLPAANPLALLFAAAGVAISAAGVWEFRRTRTTVNPLTPAASSSLVRSGVYAFTRNPMYLGFLFALIAWALWLSHALALPLVPAFVAYIDRLQIRPEERILAAKFGPVFAEYQSRVRRWL